MSNFKNKVVLITGASSGIGAGTAEYFASAGATLALVARSKDKLEEVAQKCKTLGASKVLAVSHDLSIESECIQAVQDTINEFNGIDVFVNSAGILVSGGIETLSAEDYDKCMNINTRCAFILTQQVIPHLIKSKGNLVHVSSVTGLRAFPGVLAYNMSKAALDQLTRTVALEVADKGVRVNAVNPGVIVTEVHKRAGMNDADYEKFLEHSKTTHAMGRVGTVQEVAATIGFLASPEASFITGQTLAIDGGRSIMCPR
eukprot:TRINITY_DN12677_c0_g1_i1.p1 TRINITY_DN12677_c0_g1~~TRINITY_DN12677_c0_g1_i1.p1  ORF type:complete len:258 (-),score=47.52 TRINITY_DN12677_c0_g1_i1:77-850(-)